MKPARLVVRNFGPLKDIDIKVTDFLCLIGKQATGKSTIAKLIAVFEDENFSDESFKHDLSKYGLEGFLKNDTYISYKVDEYNITSILYFNFTYEENKISLNNFKSYFKHLFETKNSKGNQNRIDAINEISKYLLDDLMSFDDAFMFKKLKTIYKDLESEMRQHQDLLKDIKFRLSNDENNKKISEINSNINIVTKGFEKTIDSCYKKIIELLKVDSQYIPSERNFLHLIAENTLGLINNKVQIPAHLLEIGQEYEKALNVVKEIPLNLIDKNFRYQRDGKNSYIYHSKEDKVDLLKSASGMQSLIPIILLIEYAKTLKENYHFNYIVEEPELNIYPKTQHQLIKYLVKNIFDLKLENYQRKKLVITTHSPYILASINNLLLAYQKGQEKAVEVQKIIKREFWVNPKNFSAYELKKGKSYKIMNDKIGQIKSNIIDTVTDEFSDEFDKLLSL